MTLQFIGERLGMKIYTSDSITDKVFMFSKHCRACGEEIDIFNNIGICWLSPDRTHHPSFVIENIKTEQQNTQTPPCNRA